MDSDARQLTRLIHDLARLTRVEADRRARIHGMTLAQWKLLAQLQRTPGMSQKEAADMLEVEPITVARLVDRMETAKLLERRPDVDDRRVWRLHPTPASAAVLAKMDAQGAELSEQVAAGIDHETRAALIETLRLMKKNLARSFAALPLTEPV